MKYLHHSLYLSSSCPSCTNSMHFICMYKNNLFFQWMQKEWFWLLLCGINQEWTQRVPTGWDRRNWGDKSSFSNWKGPKNYFDISIYNWIHFIIYKLINVTQPSWLSFRVNGEKQTPPGGSTSYYIPPLTLHEWGWLT